MLNTIYSVNQLLSEIKTSIFISLTLDQGLNSTLSLECVGFDFMAIHLAQQLRDTNMAELFMLLNGVVTSQNAWNFSVVFY